ncbi:MAG: universal stress protein [Leptolyngbya sp. SIO1E4]|nr:universal stress protein [Leptolyngbya sp. SIO1E4]
MFQRALISTDFEDGLYRLGYVAAALVEGGLTEITFFHNVAVQTDRSVPRINEEAMAAAQQRLQQAIQDVPEAATVDVCVECGRPSDNILKQMQQTSSDVIFLGMPTRNLLSEKLFGSTTMGLVERTPIPMMILRPQLISTYTTQELALRCRNLFHYLLIPYDGSQGSHEFLEVLQAQIRKVPPPAEHKYLLLWVIDDSIRRELQGDNPMQEAEERLHKAGDSLRQLGVTVETLVREGDPLEEIMLTAEQYDISAIATYSRGIGGFLRWSVPSLTREILRQSWHPVLYFPHGD